MASLFTEAGLTLIGGATFPRGDGAIPGFPHARAALLVFAK